MSLLLLFRPRGSSGPTPPPVVVIPQGGGDSTRLRRRRKGPRLRYWWEKDEDVLVLSPEEALQDPVTVQALWEEKATLNEYIIERSFEKASQDIISRLKQVDQYIQARIDAQKRRRKKAIMLLLGD